MWNGSLFSLCLCLGVAGAQPGRGGGGGGGGGGGSLAVFVLLTDVVYSDVDFLLSLLDWLQLQGLPQILLQTFRTEFL